MNDRVSTTIDSQDDVQGFARSTGSRDLDSALDKAKDLLKDFGKVDWSKFGGATVYYPQA